MTRRVFTPNSKKEQLQRQVLMMIRIIRSKMDKDVLDTAQKTALKMQSNSKTMGVPLDALKPQENVSDEPRKATMPAQPKSGDGHVAYDKENARQAIAKFLALKKNDHAMSRKIIEAMTKNH